MDSLFFSSPNSEMGDYVMMESCVDHGEDVTAAASVSSGCVRRRAARREKLRRREFPPPLTVLPFAMRRYTTGDGRLVMVEERRRRPEWLRATRSGGRLVLEIVGMEERECDDVEERECDEVEERESDDVEEREREAVKSAVAGKCYDYMRVRSSSCLFEMTVPTVRPSVLI